MTSNVKILYKEVICNGDRSLFSYLKDFLALMLQNPVEKSGVMMLFKINRIIFLQIHSSQFIVLANIGYGFCDILPFIHHNQTFFIK